MNSSGAMATVNSHGSGFAASATQHSSAERWKIWLGAVAVMIAAVLPYLNSLANGFALDDVPIIQRNPTVHALNDVERIWTSPYWPVSGSTLGLYRPLTSVLFAVQWVAGDGHPCLFHLVNIGLHGLASMLVFGLLFTLFRGIGRDGLGVAVLGAVTFAVHPIHTEAVANIVGQAELTAAIALLAACWLYAARPADARVGPFRVGVLMCLYLLALNAKEHAIVLPALLIVLDFAQGRTEWRRAALMSYIRAIVPLMIGLALVACLFLAARTAVLGSLLGANANPALPYLRAEGRIWNALRAWPEFFRLLLFPIDLSADYSPGVIQPVNGLTPTTIAGGLLLLLTIIVSFRVAHRSILGLAAAWLLIAILPVSNLLFPIGVLVAERALYLPSVAVSILVATTAAHALPSLTAHKRALAAAAAAVLVALGVRTALRNPVWKSTRTVQASVVRTHPESYRAQWSAAAAALREGDTARARLHYTLGYRIYHQDPVFVAEVGNYHIGRGDLHAALPYLQEARALYPRFPRAQIYSAYVFNRIGRPDSAFALLASITPGSRDMTANLRLIWSERARALEGLRRYDEASAVWHLIARDGGESAWLYHALRARALARAGRVSQAETALAESHAQATEQRARAALERLADQVESGCFATSSCRADPLLFWTGP